MEIKLGKFKLHITESTGQFSLEYFYGGGGSGGDSGDGVKDADDVRRLINAYIELYKDNELTNK